MSYWDDEEPRTTTCKYCGQDGLHWEDDNGKWVLLTKSIVATGNRQPSGTFLNINT